MNPKSEQEFNTKWNIHKVVQEAIEKSHAFPSPQTLSEICALKEVNKKIMEKIDDFSEKLEAMRIQIAELPEKMFEKADQRYVNKDRFMTVERAVFALIGALCLGVVYLILNHFLK